MLLQCASGNSFIHLLAACTGKKRNDLGKNTTIAEDFSLARAADKTVSLS